MSVRNPSRRGRLLPLALILILGGITIEGVLILGVLSPTYVITLSLLLTVGTGFSALPALKGTYEAIPYFLFWIANLIFLQAVPLILVITGLSFLADTPPKKGFASCAALAYHAQAVCWLSFWWLRTSRIASPAERHITGGLHFGGLQRQRVTLVAVFFALLGTIGIIGTGVGGLFLNAGNYEAISDSLSGRGMYLRLAELLAIGGILLLVSFRKGYFHWWLGLVFLGAFCLWRAGYGNRENAVMYLVILWLYSFIVRETPFTRPAMVKLLVLITALCAILPLLGVFRSGMVGQPAAYSFLALRDLGFSEVAASLMDRDIDWKPPGILQGVATSTEVLLPRSIFPNKSDPSAKEITALVTPVEGYVESGMLFAYAPSYVGQLLYWSPNRYRGAAIILLLFVCAIISYSAKIATRNSEVVGGIRTILFSFVSYKLFFSSVKLDLYNLLGSAVVPILALAFAIVWVRGFRVKV